MIEIHWLELVTIFIAGMNVAMMFVNIDMLNRRNK